MLLDFFIYFFHIEIHRPNAMVDDDHDRPEASLLLSLAAVLTSRRAKLVETVSRESGLKAQEPKN
jgi:hypothetical protein